MNRPTVLAIEALAAVLVGVAWIVALSGGWRPELFGVSVSVRAVWRPLVVACGLVAARWWATRVEVSRARAFSDAAARICAGGALVAAVLGWLTYLSPYVGGADSYGYVSASERLRSGSLIQHEPLADVLPYDLAILPATPIGYVPAARVSNASVPTYPLGFPALIAISATLFGSRSIFFVPLGMAVVLVATCYWLVLRWTGDRIVVLTAGAAVGWHPVVFAYAIQMMSDVPATAFYMLAAALLTTTRSLSAAIAGVAGGGALLIRPALLPGIGALALIPWTSGENRRNRIVIFGVAIVASIGAQASLQWYLYGSPFANGYGSSAELFSIRFLPDNVRSYAHWIGAMHGVIWIAGLAAGLFAKPRPAALALLSATAIGAIVPYSVYRPYDHWETQRFLLPLLVMATLIAVMGMFAFARRFLPRAGTWVALALVIVLIGTWTRWLAREQVFTLARAEQRFSEAGELVARVTPERSVILASLHSGSLRYYAHRSTIDWARVPPGQLDATVAALVGNGDAVFLMLDGDEERSEFEARHGHAVDEQGWLPSGQRRDVRLYQFPAAAALP